MAMGKVMMDEVEVGKMVDVEGVPARLVCHALRQHLLVRRAVAALIEHIRNGKEELHPSGEGLVTI